MRTVSINLDICGWGTKNIQPTKMKCKVMELNTIENQGQSIKSESTLCFWGVVNHIVL